jgi:hypothetical protein
MLLYIAVMNLSLDATGLQPELLTASLNISHIYMKFFRPSLLPGKASSAFTVVNIEWLFGIV